MQGQVCGRAGLRKLNYAKRNIVEVMLPDREALMELYADFIKIRDRIIQFAEKLRVALPYRAQCSDQFSR
jgi:hypothetical protein